MIRKGKVINYANTKFHDIRKKKLPHIPNTILETNILHNLKDTIVVLSSSSLSLLKLLNFFEDSNFKGI